MASGLSSVLASQLKESELLKKKTRLLEEQKLSFNNLKNRSFNLIIKTLEDNDLASLDKTKLIESIKLVQNISNERLIDFTELKNILKNIKIEEENVEW